MRSNRIQGNNYMFKAFQKKCSNIELLRIVAMLMIVAHHYCLHGVFNYWHANNTLTCYLNNSLTGIIAAGGKLGVDLFILITGYFMIVSKYKFTNAVKVYLETLIYSLILLVISYLYGEHYVPSKILNSSLFPFGGNAYWFISTYLMLYIFIPFLNKFILTSKKTMLNSFIIITTILWMIIPTFAHANYSFSNLAWFIYLYFIGASIRLRTYASIFSNKKLFKKLSAFSIIILIINSFIRCLCDEVNLWNTFKLASMNSVFIVSIAVYIFHYFKDLQIGCNKFINFISASVLGVYLLHDNNIVRPFLWRVIFHPCDVMDKSYMILYLIGVVLIIFTVGIITDKLIMAVFGRFINKIIGFLQNIDIKKRKSCYKRLLKLIPYRTNQSGL